MRVRTAFAHSNGKLQKRTGDTGKHGDRVTKELAFARSTDNPPNEQERKHHPWAQTQEGENVRKFSDGLFSQ